MYIYSNICLVLYPIQTQTQIPSGSKSEIRNSPRPAMLALSTKPWLSYNFQGKNHCIWELKIFEKARGHQKTIENPTKFP